MIIIPTSQGLLRKLEAGSALTDALMNIADATGQTLDGASAESLMRLFLNGIRDRTGIDAPALFGILQTATQDPEAAVRGVITKLDGEGRLQSAINRLVALQGERPWLLTADASGDLRFLSLADVTGQEPVSLDWKVGDSVDAPPADTIMFSVSGEAKAALKLRVADQELAARDFAVDLATLPNGRLVAFTLQGDLGAAGELNAPVGAAAASLSAGVEIHGALRYLYQYPADTKTIGGLVGALQNAPDPFDLDSVAAHIKSPAAAGLREMRLERAGAGWLTANINLARAVSSPRLIKAPEGAQTLSLNEKLGVSVDLSFRAEGTRALAVRRNEVGHLVLSATRQSMRRRQTGLEVGASIELVGLGEVAGAWAEHLLPKIDELTGRIADYAQPGDILVTEIRKKLKGKAPWVQRLGEVALGETDTAKLKASVGDYLAKRVKEAFDTVIPVVDFGQGSSEELVDRLMAHLTASNSALAFFRADLADHLQTSLAGRLDAYWRGLKRAVGEAEGALAKEVTGGSKKAVAKTLAPLEDFGLEAKKAVKDLNKSGEALIGPVIRLLKRYSEQRAKLINAVAESARAKVGLSLTLGREREETGSSSEIVTLTASDAGGYGKRAQADYKRWLLGRLPEDADFDDHEIRPRQGDVGYRVAGKQTANITLDLGPLTFGYESIVKAHAEFKVSHDGTILVGKAGFEGRESAKEIRNRSAEAHFGGMIPVLDTETGRVTGAPFLLGYLYRNTDCSRGDLDDFFASVCGLEPAGAFDILPPERRKALLAAFRERDTERARVDMDVAVSARGFATMARESLDERRLAEHLWSAYAERNERQMDAVYGIFEDQPGREADVVLALNAKKQPRSPRESTGTHFKGILAHKSSRAGRGLSQAYKLVLAFDGIKRFFAVCRELVAWRSTLTLPPGLSMKKKEEWARDNTVLAYEKAMAAADALRWAVDAAAQAATADEVPPDMLALMSYIDERLGDTEVAATLALETAPKDDPKAWSLVRL